MLSINILHTLLQQDVASPIVVFHQSSGGLPIGRGSIGFGGSVGSGGTEGSSGSLGFCEGAIVSISPHTLHVLADTGKKISACKD